MADTVNSPNMALPVPIVGVDPGPQYATDVNNCLSILDQHSHIPGSGVPITPSAMNINEDLNMLNNDLTSARSVRFAPSVTPLPGSTPDLGCVYVSGVDLYYNDVNGNQIQITDSGGVAGANGNITNLTPPASAVYISLDETFRWQSNADVAADMDFRSAVLRNSTSMSFGLTLSAPVLGSDYSIVLPQLPGASSFVSIDASGNMGASIPLAQGITGSNIANLTITAAQIANSTITNAKMAANSVDTSQLVDQSVTQAKLAPRPDGSVTPSAGQIGYSQSSGTFSTISGVPTTISNFQITITTTGRPVRIAIQNDFSTGDAFLQVDITSGTSCFGALNIRRGGVVVAEENMRIEGNPGDGLRIPPGSIDMIDMGVAGVPGTYIYDIQAYTDRAFSVRNCRMVVYEL